jgi:hypothetical protein
MHPYRMQRKEIAAFLLKPVRSQRPNRLDAEE